VRPLRRPAQTDVEAQRRHGLRLPLTRRAAEEIGAADTDHFLVALVDAAQRHRAFEPAVDHEARYIEPPPPLDGPERARSQEMIARAHLTNYILGPGIEKRLGQPNADAPLHVGIRAWRNQAVAVGEIDDIEIEPAA